jgi:hypothetical protein
MNWIYSSATRAGLGPPEWIVIAIIFSLLLVGALESGGTASESQGALLTKRDKRVLAVGIAIVGLPVAFLLWRKLAG